MDIQNWPKIDQVSSSADKRGRKKTISDPEFGVPRGAVDPTEWGLLEASDHEVLTDADDSLVHNEERWWITKYASNLKWS